MRSKSTALVLLVLVGCHSSSDSEPDSDTPLQAQGLAVNLGLAVDLVFGAGGQWLVGASEKGQGRDLDGDGDRTDVVLHLLDLGARTLTNTNSAYPELLYVATDVRPPRFGSNDRLAVFQVSEEKTGRDLDGDGILGEVSTRILDQRTGVSRDLSFEHVEFELGDELAALTSRDATGSFLHVFDGRDGSLTTLPVEAAAPAAVQGRLVFFTRNENGAFDLNADGDALDSHVLHRYDADSGRIVNTTLNGGQVVHVVDGFAGFIVGERDQGQDLNSDGDRADRIFTTLELRSGQVRITGITGAQFVNPFVAPDDESQAFLLTVAEQGIDRNGDGDTLDDVALFYEPRSERVLDTSVALDVSSYVQAGPWIGVRVAEWNQGDLDGDGETSFMVPHVLDALTGSSVNLGFRGEWLAAFGEELLGARQVFRGTELVENELFVWDPSTRLARMTGLDVRQVLGSVDGRALVIAAEGARDLNGDRDRRDLVFALYDGRTGSLRSLGLAAGWGRLASRGQAVVTVSEAGQGVDLNRDGDREDLVLHRIHLDPRAE